MPSFLPSPNHGSDNPRPMIYVGIDEAGYGPTLGPLVVSAAAFRIPDRLIPGGEMLTVKGETSPSPGDAPAADVSLSCELDLWSLLSGIVTRKPDRSRIPVDDSKRLYRPGKGLARLEEGLLPFLLLRGDGLPPDFRELLTSLRRAPESTAYLDTYPWYRGRNLKIPTATYANYVGVLSERLRKALDGAGIEFLGIVSIPIEVDQFNRTLASGNNKSLVPFQAVGHLLSRLWKSYPDERVEGLVDRQGGRIQYAALLYETVQPRGIHIDCQTPEVSLYRLRPRRGRGTLKVAFTRQGDSKSFTVALASMASKYLRELHMQLFNQYWSEQQDGLRPTAGYPTDARRFLTETATLRRQLGTDDHLLIRQR